MKHSERGAARLLGLFWLALLAFVILLVVELAPALFTRYSIGLALADAGAKISYERTDDEIKGLVGRAFNDARLDYDPQLLSIRRSGDRIRLIYHFGIDLGIPESDFRYPIDLTREAESAKLHLD